MLETPAAHAAGVSLFEADPGNEIEIALDHHELVKIKVNAGDREERDAAVGVIAKKTGSDLINRIGNTAAFFRANPEKKNPIKLPTD